MKGSMQMKKERYERTDLEITLFEKEDVITTSGLDSSGGTPSDKYEGGGFAED